MARLAINGGQKIRTTLFPAYRVIGREEESAVVGVLRTGILSKYLGCWDEDFYGGPQVRTLEEEWADYFGAKYAVSVNSATSALICAVGAIGISPEDEVIVCPYTMCASASAPLIYNAIPVFADIEHEYFCLDPASVEEKITSKTKAIIVVNIFGQPHAADEIRAIAKRHGLYVIEDNAQGPGAFYKGKAAGTLGDIGVFSLNYHKHIHCGEGGVAVTDDANLAERLRLIRNHAEAVVEAKGWDDLVNMFGFNMRMTEIEAAISREQLKKLQGLVDERIENVKYISQRLKDIPCLRVPDERKDVTHVYYQQPLFFVKEEIGAFREKYVEAVKAELMPTELRESEGVKIGCGYAKPLYLQPIFQKRLAYGRDGYPFNKSTVTYSKGICPVCEKLFEEELITHDLMRPGMTQADLDDVCDAFEKVYEYREELK